MHFLDQKQEKLVLYKSNKNDAIKLLGPPSTGSDFDESLLIYIERSTSSAKLVKLGKKKLLKNNVLVLDFDNRNLLVEKIFLNKEDMKKLEFSKDFTTMSLTKKTFVYDFLSSIRQKINDPLGKKRISND